MNFLLKTGEIPRICLNFDFLRFLGQAYAKLGPKSGPGGSKIDPGGSKIDPGGSKIDPGASPERPKTETSGEEVHRELPESVPGAFFEASSIFSLQKGLQKGSKREAFS